MTFSLIVSFMDIESNIFFSFFFYFCWILFYLLVQFLGRSYVVGYGKNSPKQPLHAASSCPDRPAPCGWADYDKNESNPQILYGALVSGPNENDEFNDHREEDIYTEVLINYNAGFTSALAGLLQLQLDGL